MEIVADLFGWGIVGVTVAAPLVSLMTDLRERKDGRGGATHPSPDTKHDLPECGAHAPAPGATGGTVVTDAEAPSPGCCSRRPRRKKGSAEPRALPRVAEESCAPNVGTSSAPRLAIPHAEPVALRGVGHWTNKITPPPLRMFPRSESRRDDADERKAWNASTKRVFSANASHVSSYTMTECQGPHPHWEDRHIVCHHRERMAFGVFDGHGRGAHGAAASEFCSAHVQHSLEAAHAHRTDASDGGGGVVTTPDPCSELRVAFLNADRDFVRHMPAEASESGTTALVVSIGQDTVCVANAGDCRAVLSRGGRAVNLTTDHKPCLPSEFARIQAAGGRIVRPDPRGPLRLVSPDGRTGLAVSRGLGDYSFKDPRFCRAPLLDATPDVVEVDLVRGVDELIIMASDGLWDVLTSQQAVDMARAAPSSQLASDLLVREAIACGSQDNVTVLVVRL